MAVIIPARRSRIPSVRDILLFGMACFLAATQALPRLAALAQDGGSADARAAVGTAFTHQGRLVVDGVPADGAYDFEFALFDVATNGSALVTLPALLAVPVNNGLYSVQIDFGGGAFNGQARWLEVHARPAGGGTFTNLGRQEMTAAPYALYARATDWSGITNKPAGLEDGDNDTTYTASSPVALNGTAFGFSTTDCQAGDVWKFTGTGSGWSCDPDIIGDPGLTYTAESPLALNGTTFGFSSSGCQAGDVWTYVGPGWSCDTAAAGGDITAVIAGTGLTGGATTGDATLAADFGGDGIATTVSRSDHTHLYQDWFGSDPNIAALTLRNLDTDGLALSIDAGRIGIQAGASSANSYGVWGQSNGTNGIGVRGIGSTGVQAEGNVYGVRSFANLAGAQAVRGEANQGSGVVGVSLAKGFAGTSGINNGTACNSGSFESATDNCIGVYGEALSGSLAIGMFGAGKNYGVYGIANANFASGVRGVSNNGEGTGVSGINRHPNCTVDVFVGGDCVGVYGSTTSVNGAGVVGRGGRYGVYGITDLNTAGNVGVYGEAERPDQWAGYFEGKVHVNGMLTSSDIRLKKEIGTSAGLAEVLKLQPVSYNWIADDGLRHQGLIAQDVQQVMPDLVSDDGVPGEEARLSVNYTELVPVLIKAIQEQQALIDGRRSESSGFVPHNLEWATFGAALTAVALAAGALVVAAKRR